VGAVCVAAGTTFHLGYLSTVNADDLARARRSHSIPREMAETLQMERAVGAVMAIVGLGCIAYFVAAILPAPEVTTPPTGPG
jgi:hypothetical protein